MKIIQVKTNGNYSDINNTCANCIKGVKIPTSKTIEEKPKTDKK